MELKSPYLIHRFPVTFSTLRPGLRLCETHPVRYIFENSYIQVDNLPPLLRNGTDGVS